MKKLLLIGVAVVSLLLPMTASAGPRFGGFGGPRVGVGFGYYGGGWYSPYWGPYPYYGMVPNVGTVKLDTDRKDAQVFVNGAYAGTVKEMKTMMLHPGSYTIGIRATGLPPFETKVFVTAGKTLKIRPS